MNRDRNPTPEDATMSNPATPVHRRTWQTLRDNYVERWMVRPGLKGKPPETYRVVWEERSGDVAYVVPSDGDNGNRNAALIAVAPALLAAVEALLPLALAYAAETERLDHQFTAHHVAMFLASLEEKGL
jgi:hypothetical protein